MKVLLVNPNSSAINKSWAYRRFCSPIAPLGLCYIAAVLRANGIGVSVFDQFANKAENQELLDFIKKDNPEIIGFSVLTPLVRDVEDIVAKIRKISPRCLIIFGNIHATCFPEDVLSKKSADIVVRGEGEMTMLEICARVGRGEGLCGIQGISYIENGAIVHNPDRPLLENLDELPYPAWDLLDLENYRNHPMVSISNIRVLPLLASRGCKYRCYYCSQDKLYNSARYRSLERVVDEMEYFYITLGIKFFGFCDAYFPFDEASGLRFCALLKERSLDKKIRWITETRVDKVTPAMLKIMKESGLHLIMYGIEVGNSWILESLKKGTTLQQARDAVKEAKKHGIITQGLFILGLPGETEDTCRDTINFAMELDCDLVKFNIATPYPGSEFFNDCLKSEAMRVPESYTSWADWTGESAGLVYSPKGIPQEKLKHLQRKAMFQFYARAGVIFKHITRGTIQIKDIAYGGAWVTFLFLSSLFKFRKSGATKRRRTN